MFKHPFFTTTGPISTKFGTNHPEVDGIQIFTNKDQHPPQGEMKCNEFIRNCNSDHYDLGFIVCSLFPV